jgi:hypothetical protein
LPTSSTLSSALAGIAKLPTGEKERAIRAKRDFEERLHKGTYYEKE